MRRGFGELIGDEVDTTSSQLVVDHLARFDSVLVPSRWKGVQERAIVTADI
jgi:hypothetical protein